MGWNDERLENWNGGVLESEKTGMKEGWNHERLEYWNDGMLGRELRLHNSIIPFSIIPVFNYSNSQLLCAFARDILMISSEVEFCYANFAG
jgi:hypothetical protein